MKKVNTEDMNRNKLEIEKGLKYEGLEILKVLNIVIGDEVFYNCILEDGSVKAIPKRFFEGGK